MPKKQIGIDIGTRGAKNTEVKNKFEVLESKHAISTEGPSKRL